jgi:hypothetical protein
LILNWTEANNAFAMGATEGLNNNARTFMKRDHGFRTLEHPKSLITIDGNATRASMTYLEIQVKRHILHN